MNTRTAAGYVAVALIVGIAVSAALASYYSGQVSCYRS